MDDADLREDPELAGYPPEVDHGKPPTWAVVTIVATIILLIVANNVGRTLLTKWAEPGGGLRHPVWLLSLNSSNIPLLATGFQVDWVWFLTVPLLRLFAPDPLFYLLGHFYRHSAKKFLISVYPGSAGLFELMHASGPHGGAAATPREAAIGRFTLDAAVLIAPNNPVCAIAGVLAMPPKRFLVLNVVGTVGRLILFKCLSMYFREEVQSMINWIARYQSKLFIASLVLLVVNVVLSSRRVSAAGRNLRDS